MMKDNLKEKVNHLKLRQIIHEILTFVHFKNHKMHFD